MFKLTIATPKGLVYSGNAVSVSIPSEEGQQQILTGHEPYMTDIGQGELIYTDDQNKTIKPYIVSSGFLHVKDNVVSIALGTAVHISEIDIEKAKEAKARAEKMLSELKINEDISKVKAEIQLANLHISSAMKHHRSLSSVPTGDDKE